MMKKYVFIVLAMVCIACSNDDSPPYQDIRLSDKPLSVIKSHIEGKWQLHYTKGGLIANLVHPWENVYWEFNFRANDRIKTTAGPISADTTITWIKERGTFTAGDSTYIMEFYDKENVPNHFVIDSIYHDTLVLHINAADAMFFHFTKQ